MSSITPRFESVHSTLSSIRTLVATKHKYKVRPPTAIGYIGVTVFLVNLPLAALAGTAAVRIEIGYTGRISWKEGQGAESLLEERCSPEGGQLIRTLDRRHIARLSILRSVFATTLLLCKTPAPRLVQFLTRSISTAEQTRRLLIWLRLGEDACPNRTITIAAMLIWTNLGKWSSSSRPCGADEVLRRWGAISQPN